MIWVGLVGGFFSFSLEVSQFSYLLSFRISSFILKLRILSALLEGSLVAIGASGSSFGLDLFPFDSNIYVLFDLYSPFGFTSAGVSAGSFPLFEKSPENGLEVLEWMRQHPLIF